MRRCSFGETIRASRKFPSRIEQDREDDQYRDRANVDEDLHQPDELRAEQKEKRGETDQRHRKTERRMHLLLERCRVERSREHQNRDEEECDAAHSAK
jgi:hypothetical protein